MRLRDAFIVFVYTIGTMLIGFELFNDGPPGWYIYLNVAVMIIFIYWRFYIGIKKP